MSDDLGDAHSRLENQRFRELAQRSQGTNPEYAYAPRWAPMGNWRFGIGDLVVAVAGLAILGLVLAMHWLGYY